MHLLNIILAIYGGMLFLSIFFKTDKTKVYCGLFAYSGPRDLSSELWYSVLANLKILAMYNDSRGGDNFGIMLDQNVHKTQDHWKGLGREFLEKNSNLLVPPVISSVIIGHCRKASVGGRDAKNGHPFEIYRRDEEADPFLVGAHNGTISNWRDLAARHKMEVKTTTVDSEVFYNLLAHEPEKDFSLFKEYDGVGAFLWHYPKDPHKLYVFKGLSKEYSTSKATDERPLWFYHCPVTKGVYFSSIADSLKMIAIDPKEVKDLLGNMVYIVEDGRLSENAILIDRSEIVQRVSTYCDTSYDRGGFGHGCANPNRLPAATGANHSKAGKQGNFNFNNHISYLDDTANVKENQLKGDIIYRKHLLCFRNGHPVDGIFIIDAVTEKIIESLNPIADKSEYGKEVLKYYDDPGVEVVWICKGLLAKSFDDYQKLREIFKGFHYGKNRTKATAVYTFLGVKSGKTHEVSKLIEDPIPFIWESGQRHLMLNGGSFTGIHTPKFGGGKAWRAEYGWLKEVINPKSTADVKTVFNKVVENAQRVINNVGLHEDLNHYLPDHDDDDDSPNDESVSLIQDFESLQNDKIPMFLSFEENFVEAFNLLLAKYTTLEEFAEAAMTTAEWKPFFSFFFKEQLVDNLYTFTQGEGKDHFSYTEVNGQKKLCLKEKSLIM